MPNTVDPQTFDVTVIEDRDWTLEFTITDEADVAVDITGATANFTVKKDLDDAAGIFTPKTVGAGITLTTPLSGKLQVTGVPADTDGNDGNHIYELDITIAGINDSVRIANFFIRKKVGA